MVEAREEDGPIEAWTDLHAALNTLLQQGAAQVVGVDVGQGQLHPKLKGDPRFSQLILIGHSEGALIASLAAPKSGAAALISIAGSGRPMWPLSLTVV